MSRILVLRRVAEREFGDSVDWYQTQREGLGREFRATIEECFHSICKNPERYPTVRGDVRRLVVPRRFPFVIHFVIEADRIIILSVFHASRNPSHWKRRT